RSCHMLDVPVYVMFNIPRLAHFLCSFLFTSSAPPVLYTLSLHDALPIFHHDARHAGPDHEEVQARRHGQRSLRALRRGQGQHQQDRKSTRLNSSHVSISYAVFCLKKKRKNARNDDIMLNGQIHDTETVTK